MNRHMRNYRRANCNYIDDEPDIAKLFSEGLKMAGFKAIALIFNIPISLIGLRIADVG